MNKKDLLKFYKLLYKKLKKVPSTADCLSIGISRDMVRHHFGNLTNLKKEAGLSVVLNNNSNKNTIYKLLGVKQVNEK